MKKLLFVLLLSGCSGAFKLGNDAKPDDAVLKDIQTLFQAVNTISTNLKGVAEATSGNTLRIQKLEPKKPETK